MLYTTQRYRDIKGNVPYTAWILKVRKKDARAAAKIELRIDRAESGNFGDHKYEAGGVWELRIDYGPGYRVYYALEDHKIILLLAGGDKASQKTDLAKAVKYWRNYQKR